MERGTVRPGMSVSLAHCLLAALLSGSTMGCRSGEGIPRAAVQGAVTLNGTPVEQGSIVFFPAGGTVGPAAGASIQDGRYALSAAEGPVVGTNRVEVRASRRTGRKVPLSKWEPDSLVEEVLEAVPARYNSNSTLTYDIELGKNIADFELTSP